MSSLNDKLASPSDSTAASPDLDLNTLLRIFTPQGRHAESTMTYTSPSSSSDGSPTNNEDITPSRNELCIPLFSSTHLHNRQYAPSEVTSSADGDYKIEIPQLPTHPVDPKQHGESHFDEMSDTVEPLDLFLQHSLGPHRRKLPVRQQVHFQSPSSGTFLNKSHYGDSAQDALSRLLDCFSRIDSPATAAILKHRNSEEDRNGGLQHYPRGNEGNRCYEHFIINCLSESRELTHSPSRSKKSPNQQHDLNHQSKFDDFSSNRSPLTVIGSRQPQGSCTAPAAMITDAEAMLASLLKSLDEKNVQIESRPLQSWAHENNDDEESSQRTYNDRVSVDRELEGHWEVPDHRYPQRHLFGKSSDTPFYRPTAELVGRQQSRRQSESHFREFEYNNMRPDTAAHHHHHPGYGNWSAQDNEYYRRFHNEKTNFDRHRQNENFEEMVGYNNNNHDEFYDLQYSSEPNINEFHMNDPKRLLTYHNSPMYSQMNRKFNSDMVKAEIVF